MSDATAIRHTVRALAGGLRPQDCYTPDLLVHVTECVAAIGPALRALTPDDAARWADDTTQDEVRNRVVEWLLMTLEEPDPATAADHYDRLTEMLTLLRLDLGMGDGGE